MKTNKADFAQNVLIARDHWDVPVRVRLLPYVEFSHYIDCQLQELVARWAHAAAPYGRNRRSRRPRRAR